MELRLVLDQDNKVAALGYVDSYPYQAPDFVTDVFWRFLGVIPDELNDPAKWEPIQRQQTPEEIKKANIEKGREVILEFLTQLESVSLDTASYIAVSDQFKYVEIALQRGDLIQAAAQAESIPSIPGSLIWNAQIKAYFTHLIRSKS